jgi:hypothetical protein
MMISSSDFLGRKWDKRRRLISKASYIGGN